MKAPARPAKTDPSLPQELRVREVALQIQKDELRRAQFELEETSDRYAQLYDFAPCAYLTLNGKGEIREANLAAANLLKVERKALLDQKLTRFIKKESQDTYYFFSDKVLSSHARELAELELKSNERLIVRIESFPKLQGELVAGVRVALTDITQAKSAEEKMKRSEKLLTDFFEQASIGIQWLDRDGTILKANQAQLDILGYGREEYVGRRLSAFEADPAVARDLIGRLTAHETLNNFRARLRHKDGSIRAVLIDAKAGWSDEPSVHFSLFSRDKLDHEILEFGEREQRRIAQDLHDDLGQILTASIHLSAALQKKLAAKSLPEAKEEGQIGALLDQALSQTRSLARGLHPVKPELNGLMAALEELAGRTKDHFHCSCTFSCPQPVFLEDENIATHLFRIAQEAVTNSVKHGKPTHIEISLGQLANRVTVKVEDDGKGLSRKGPSRVGMGMRIMRYRAGIIGGTLVVQKGAKRGTSVSCTVQIPTSSQEMDKLERS